MVCAMWVLKWDALRAIIECEYRKMEVADVTHVTQTEKVYNISIL